MAYEYITKFSSQNFYAAANVPKHYGVPRQIKGITIHHWGIKGQKFQNVVNFLCRPKGNTSAHYVVEDGKVACIINPANAAWHAGNSIGNATTVGVECRPEATDGDYQTVAELIAELWRTYGKVKLYRHKDWKNTACPGDYSISRLERLAEAIYNGETIDLEPAAVVKPIKHPTGAVKPKPAAKQPTDFKNLVVDGVFGKATVSALQIVMRAIGTYDRAVDGDWGKYTQRAVQEWLKGLGKYKRAIDGQFGKHSVIALQEFLGGKGHLDTRKWLIDGKMGPATVRALQTYLNTQRA